jgi:hypothetical protein
MPTHLRRWRLLRLRKHVRKLLQELLMPVYFSRDAQLVMAEDRQI